MTAFNEQPTRMLINSDERLQVIWAEATCLARLMMDDLSGEYRYCFAPCEGGEWFAWADWHRAVETPLASRAVTTEEVAGDAGYQFHNGGAFFPSRAEAIAAICDDVAQSAAVFAGGERQGQNV